MHALRLPFVLLALAALAGCRTAGPGVVPAPAGADVVVVANQGDRSVHLLDASSGARLARLDGFDGPHEVAVSPDGRWAVVSDYGDRETRGRKLVVVDVDARAVARAIDLGEYRRPHDLRFLPDGRTLAVTAEADRAVLLVDFAGGRVVRVLDTGGAVSHMLAVPADGRRIYTANLTEGTVSELDPRTGRTVRVVAVAPMNEGIGVTPDGREVWTASIGQGATHVLDGRTLAPLDTVATPGHPYRVTFSPDGRRAFIPAPEAGAIYAVDVATRAVTRVEVAGGPSLVAFDAEGRFGYFALTEANEVGVLDLATLRVVRRLPAGPSPDGIGVARRPD